MLKTPVVDLQCQNDECGMIFQSEYLNQKYCSFRCKSRASERRRRMKDKLRRPRIVAKSESVETFHESLRAQVERVKSEPVPPAEAELIRKKMALSKQLDRGEISEEEFRKRLDELDPPTELQAADDLSSILSGIIPDHLKLPSEK